MKPSRTDSGPSNAWPKGLDCVETAEPATGLVGDAAVFGDVEGLPEVHLDDLTSQVIADALAARSGLVVRQLLSAEAVRSLREDLAFMRVMKAVIARAQAEGTFDTAAMLDSWRDDLGSLKVSASRPAQA